MLGRVAQADIKAVACIACNVVLREAVALPSRTRLLFHLLADQSVDEGSVREHTILIFWVAKLGEQFQHLILGDFITKIGKDVLQFSEHHGAIAIFVVQFAQVNVVLVGATAVGGILGFLDLGNDIGKLGELLAFFISHAKTNANLLGCVKTTSVDDIPKEEHVEFTFAIPIVDVANLKDGSLVDHFD